jgi:hypothetical protein
LVVPAWVPEVVTFTSGVITGILLVPLLVDVFSRNGPNPSSSSSSSISELDPAPCAPAPSPAPPKFFDRVADNDSEDEWFPARPLRPTEDVDETLGTGDTSPKVLSGMGEGVDEGVTPDAANDKEEEAP